MNTGVPLSAINSRVPHTIEPHIRRIVPIISGDIADNRLSPTASNVIADQSIFCVQNMRMESTVVK
jgi:hypothetical protein